MPQTFSEQTPASRTESSYTSLPQQQVEATGASVATATLPVPAAVPVASLKNPKTTARRLSQRRRKRLMRRIVPLVVFYAPALFLYAWIRRHGFIHIPFLNDKSFWLALPWQAMITFVGGLVALFEYNRNFRLKQAQFAQDKAQAEIHRGEAEKAHTQKEEQFKNDQLQKQMQFEEKAQEDLFKDIQDRLANTDTKTRTNAALRLAEMARLSKPDAKDKPVSDENNPFFLRAAAFLSTALHTEENDSVRAANKKALANMVAFVKGKEENDPLLRALIRDLCEANLTAKRAFIKSLAEFCSDKETASEPDFKLLVTAAPFVTYTEFSNGEATEVTLRSLMETDEFQTNCAIHAKTGRRNASAINSLLTAVKQDAARLIDTRDALVVALCALSCPNNLPKAGVSLGDWPAYSKEFGLDLNGAFLVGAQMERAELTGVQLNGAELTMAKLNGAILNGAALNRAKLNLAELKGAQLCGAGFNRAELKGAQLYGANLTGAILTGANLTGAKLNGTHLHGAILHGAILHEAELMGAELNLAEFALVELKGVKLHGAFLENPDGSDPANFSFSGWRDANFNGYDGKKDEQIWNWFLNHHGTPDEKAALAAQRATEAAQAAAEQAANAAENSPAIL